jgi:hypothetical protein
MWSTSSPTTPTGTSVIWSSPPGTGGRAPYAVKDIDWAGRHINVNVTRDQVKSIPEWDPLAMMDQVEEQRLPQPLRLARLRLVRRARKAIDPPHAQTGFTGERFLEFDYRMTAVGRVCRIPPTAAFWGSPAVRG